jgi:hypothetical protein
MKKILALAVFGVLCLSSLAQAQYAATGTTTLQLTIGPEAAIQINTAITPLTTSTTTFANPFTGTTSFSYKIRTLQTGGTGSITALVQTDFTAVANGPSVASPPTAGDALTYTCTVAAPGSACSGAQTASTTVAGAVASFAADAHANGAAGSVDWSLTNDPIYPTGTYNATVLFTISAA